ncbi:hypothetical protein [Sphingomonas hengshuiensis]|uniref:Uncharacterized protein n=1 Tax=Sphingomonas hengshuiensis TaxID=1609977 RepID=A0A7U4J990_9SPHN|nr:hypothetical protein [Sphingomonas hengshuiensis]AJP72603.1 hypothetical protein TS85_13725 [Sphingomonas hengshuiensis]
MTPPLTPLQRQAWRVVRASGVFDPGFYRSQPGVPEGEEPLDHYLRSGEATGLWPHPLFDPAWYRAQPGDAAMPMGPLAHYLMEGDRARLQPVPGFDIAYVTRQLPDAKVPALAAFARARAEWRLVNPNPFFDYGDYLAAHPEAAARDDAYRFFLLEGAEAGHLPISGFDWKWLRDYYPKAEGRIDGYRRLVHDWSGRGPAPEIAKTIFTLLRAARDVLPAAAPALAPPYRSAPAPLLLVAAPDDPRAARLARTIGDDLGLAIERFDGVPEAGAYRAAIVCGAASAPLIVPLVEAGLAVTHLVEALDFPLVAMLAARRFRAVQSAVRTLVPRRGLARSLIRAGLAEDQVRLLAFGAVAEPQAGAARAIGPRVAGDGDWLDAIVRAGGDDARPVADIRQRRGDWLTRLTRAGSGEGIRVAVLDPGNRGRDWLTALVRLAAGEGLVLSVPVGLAPADADVALLLGGDSIEAALGAWAVGTPVVAMADSVEVADRMLGDPSLGAVADATDRPAVLAAIRRALESGSPALRRLAAAPFASAWGEARAIAGHALRAPLLDAILLGAGGATALALSRQSLPARTIRFAGGGAPALALAAGYGICVGDGSPASALAMVRAAARSDADYVHIADDAPEPGPDFYADAVARLEADPALAMTQGVWRRDALAHTLAATARALAGEPDAWLARLTRAGSALQVAQ